MMIKYLTAEQREEDILDFIKQYIKDNGYTVNGFPQEIYLEGNFDNNSDKNIVWIIIPIK